MLNWKEIDLILSELDLEGAQIQKAVQTAFDVLCLKIYGKLGAKNILIALTPGACRIHETFHSVPKSDRPLRFAEFLNSKAVNGRIEEAVQLGADRVVRLTIRAEERRLRLYARLWSNAANIVVTDENGTVLDAMRRLPKRGEITGGRYCPEEFLKNSEEGKKTEKEYRIREFEGLDGKSSFNEKIDAFYAEQGGALSLETLREQAKRLFEGKISRLSASIEKLCEKEADFLNADRLKEYGDIILANISAVGNGAEWLDALNFYTGETIRIALDPKRTPAQQAEAYYEKYRKAKNGLDDVRGEIAAGKKELERLEKTLAELLTETNPLVLRKKLKTGAGNTAGVSEKMSRADQKRPGLSFRRNGWLLIVGRDAAENDDLLRHHVKGNDLWLHTRDFAGSYVFIKQQAGKSFPLDVLLDAGNLALFYSKGRNNGEADLFYTPVKFLRRAKNGPKGLVIPTQEKNLHIKTDEKRLKELESRRIEKEI
jgi:predicted ribosome quality control (RQC) complex YloA/Tae2 family protein